VEEPDSRLKGIDGYYFNSETIDGFKIAMENCRLFVAEDDIIGIAPQNAQEGDVVCIVKGAFAPCILRHIDRDQWCLVSGDCHLCGHNFPMNYIGWETIFKKVNCGTTSREKG